MKIFQYLNFAWRNLPRRGQHNVVKILCLALGLSMSAVIIAEVYYEQTYNQCFSDHLRICRVTEAFKTKNQELGEHAKTSGGVAPLMKKTIAKVELATRINPISSAEVELDNKTRIKADIYLADSCFFDMFPAKILEGNARKGLTDPFCCVVSHTTAERLGGNVVGKRLTDKSIPEIKLTIMAVYEDFPHNSSFHHYDVIGAMNTQKAFNYDGQDNLLGNDRYSSFVRLAEGTDPDELKPYIHRMIQTNYPVKDLQQAGVEMSYRLTPISEFFTNQPDVKKMFWILSLLAFVLLAASVLNYVLIVVGNLVGRAREMAVRKCYGAGRLSIFGITFGETAVHLVLSLVLGGALIWSCQGTIEQLLSAPLSVLIFNRGAWILCLIILLVLVVGGLVPAIFYNRMPVAIAFRGFIEARHRWKVALLGLEFAMVSFLLGLLVVVSLQYRHIIGFDMGYCCEDIAVVNISTLAQKDKQTAADEVRKMPGVKRVAACNTLPFYNSSGNNVRLPGEKEELFNIADLYTVNDNYFAMMHIPMTAGRTFKHKGDSLQEVMVSQSFAKMMKKTCGWDDVIGRKVVITEHANTEHPLTIIGVYRDIYIGSATNGSSSYPSALFYGSYTSPMQNNLMIQLADPTTEQLAAIQEQLQRFFPTNTVLVESMESLKNLQYTPQKNFRDGVMTAGIIVLFIALIGLVGYVNDEINRRHKEIAIRKVNGARVCDILNIFQRDIMKTAIPAVIVGAVAAYAVAAQWLVLYDNRITLTPWLFVGTVAAVLTIVSAVTVLNCYKAANGNPVDFLKQE